VKSWRDVSRPEDSCGERWQRNHARHAHAGRSYWEARDIELRRRCACFPVRQIEGDIGASGTMIASKYWPSGSRGLICPSGAQHMDPYY